MLWLCRRGKHKPLEPSDPGVCPLNVSCKSQVPDVCASSRGEAVAICRGYRQNVETVCMLLWSLGRTTQPLNQFSRSVLSDSWWIAAHLASLSKTNSRSLLKMISIESFMLSTQIILFRPLLLLPSVLPNIIFQWVSSSQQVTKVLELQLQHQSFQWIFRTDFL